MNWSHDTLVAWVEKIYVNPKVDPKVLCPFETGRQILRMPEIEFLRRVTASNPSIGPKKAKEYYTKLWVTFIDVRTADRRRKAKHRSKLSADKVYGSKPELEKLNPYQSFVKHNLSHKGIHTVLFFNASNFEVLAASENLQ